MNKEKINIRKVFLFLLGLIFSELGIAFYYTAVLGTDPISVFVEGISFHVDLSVGQISTICNVILGILTYLFERDRLGIGTILTILAGGPLIDLFYGTLLGIFPPETTVLGVRCIILVAGLITYALGLGLILICDLGIGPFSFPPIWLARVTKLDLKYTQIITDALFFLVGILLGGIFGPGTVVAVLLTGPLMTMFMRLIRPFAEKQGE